MVTVIIGEKPDASEHIANALAEHDLRKRKSPHGVYYWTFERGGENFVVVSAVGHLFNLKQKGRGLKCPILARDIDWVPTYLANKKSAFSKKYLQTIDDVAKDASDYVVACDYDNEGSVIGYHILKFICGKSDARRMLFSTLTRTDLIESYEKAMPHLDWENITSGETRHYLDFLYGINTSRSLMLAIKNHSKRFAILSAGRVQGPTLCLLAEREIEIKKFIPTPYWQIVLTILANGNEIEAVHEKDKIWDEKEADKIFCECKGKPAIVYDFSKEEYKQLPPPPFNITSLQTEAYRLFGYSPHMTLSIAQKLYTSAYISYPRTSSEKLPPQINYKKIIEALSTIDKYKKICGSLLKTKLKPVEGKRTDPAHEAIHPTVQPPKTKMGIHELRIYDLVCRRFLAAFGESAIRETINLVIDVNTFKFLANGKRTLEKGWMELYGPYVRFSEMIIPEMKKGDVLSVKSLDNLSKETTPPSRFSQASIIKEMEKRGLGTRATRANILETLYTRDYISESRIVVTDLGLKVATSLKNYVPDFVDEQLTKKFEKDMQDIMKGKTDKESVIREAEVALEKICNEFKENEDKIGKELGESVTQSQEEKSILGKCPNCEGELKILYSPLTKKSFVGCTSYSRCKVCNFTKTACKCPCPICGEAKGKCKCNWKEKAWTPSCQTIYPLPHGATIYSTGSVCEKCKTPIISVYRNGRKPFKMCLATDCATKADWGKPKKSNKTV